MAATTTDVARGVPVRTRRPVRQVCWLTAGYAGYAAVRNTFGRHATNPALAAQASHRGQQLLAAERALRLDPERGLQRLALHAPVLVRGLDVFYGLAHPLVTVTVVAWLLATGTPERNRRAHAALAAATAVALVCFATMPVMPPRLLPAHYGFIDTLSTVGGLWSYRTPVIEHISDPFAAMPSLHVVWASWCAYAIWPALRCRRSRLTAAAYPTATVLTVLVTGNHYLVDVLAGGAVFVAGVMAADRLVGPGRPSPGHLG